MLYCLRIYYVLIDRLLTVLPVTPGPFTLTTLYMNCKSILHLTTLGKLTVAYEILQTFCGEHYKNCDMYTAETNVYTFKPTFLQVHPCTFSGNTT